MDKRIQKTRKAIREAYFKILKDKKDQRITVAEIAREANIDRKTFYLHYECVDDILKEFCDDLVSELLMVLRTNHFFEDPLNMKIIFDALNNILERDMELYRMLSASTIYNLFWDRIHQIMVQALFEVYSDKVSVSGEDFIIYCNFFITGLIRIYLDFLKDPESLDVQRLSNILLDIAGNGVTRLFETKKEPHTAD